MSPEKVSFIPKSPFSKTGKTFYKSPGLGLVGKFSVLLFIFSLLSLGGAVFYKHFLLNQLDIFNESLKRARAVFDSNLISEMKRTSIQINLVKEILNHHIYPSKILAFLEENTLSGISFSDFKYSYSVEHPTSRPQGQSFSNSQEEGGIISQNEKNIGGNLGKVEVRLKGLAKNYTVLAQQSEILKKAEFVKDFSFSDFSLNSEGYVSFSLNLEFNPKIISYYDEESN